MKYLLDTNICIYIINNKPTQIRQYFERCSPGDIGISSITLAELQYGVEKSTQRDKNQQALTQFILPLEVLPFDHMAAIAYGFLRAMLEKKGKLLGALDMQIAAHALSSRSILVTNDRRFFRGLEEVRVEEWSA